MGENTLNGKCSACDHVWVVAYLPMELSKVAKLAMAARCPKGCDAKVLVGGELPND